VPRRSRSTTSTDVGIDLAVRDGLMAAVFDANCFSEGRPDLDHLALLADRLAVLNIGVWVPEPVAWEWAEHLAVDWDAARVNVAAAGKRLKKAGLQTYTSPYSGKDSVVDAFMQQLQQIPHVTLIPLTADSAYDGLRDQILQHGPARRKDGVKTGASDAAWLRDVLRRTGNSPSALLMVTEDQDIPRAFEAWGMPAPLMRRCRDLLATLFTVTVDNGSATTAVTRYLMQQLATDNPTPLVLASTPNLGHALWQLPEVGYYRDCTVTGASLSQITALAGISDVTVETPETDTAAPSPPPGLFDQDYEQSTHLVMATVFLLADAEAVLHDLPRPHSPERETVMRTHDLASVFHDGLIMVG
jgi:hypothetical protein